MPLIPAPQFAVAVPQIAPSSIAEAISESDSTTYQNVRSVWVGGDGDLVVTMNGDDVTFTGVKAGSLLPISITALKTGSSVTNVVLLF